MSIYLTEDSEWRAERATLGFRYPNRHRVARMIAEEWAMPAHANPPKAGDANYEPGERIMASVQRNRTLLALLGCSAAFALFLALCALAGWAYANGGLR